MLSCVPDGSGRRSAYGDMTRDAAPRCAGPNVAGVVLGDGAPSGGTGPPPAGPVVAGPPTASPSPAARTDARPTTSDLLVPAGNGDGDSWRDTDGHEYRLGLVNTPEQDECFGAEATAERRARTADGFRARVYGTDRYGRAVSVVTTADGIDLNVHLARNGFANDQFLAEFRSENEPLARELDTAFAAARREGKGLWSACRASGPPAAAAVPTARAGGAPAARCHPDYSTCLPVRGDGSGWGGANDLDCGEVTGECSSDDRASTRTASTPTATASAATRRGGRRGIGRGGGPPRARAAQTECIGWSRSRPSMGRPQEPRPVTWATVRTCAGRTCRRTSPALAVGLVHSRTVRTTSSWLSSRQAASSARCRAAVSASTPRRA